MVALLNLVAVVSLPFREEVREHNAGGFFTPYLATAGLVSAALAMFLAVVMRRRKRAAWMFNMLLAGPLFALYVLALTQAQYQRHGLNWLSALFTGLFVVALLLAREEFQAVGDRSNPRLALAVAVGGVVVSGTLGTVLVSVTNRVSGAPLGDRIAYTLLRSVSVGPLADHLDSVVAPRWADALINVLAAVTFLLVLYACFRAPRGRELLGEDDEKRLRALLARHGERDSLGYFALRRDKAVIWSPTGKAAITYRIVGGVALASGDPIGDPEAWPGAIEVWLREARRHAWTPAVMGASEEAGTIYARHGLDALELGDEAIVDRVDFTLEGRAMRGVRQAHNRVRRAGYTVRVRRHEDIPESDMATLVDRADHWRDGETERGFSMALGRLGDPLDGRCVMLECHDSAARPRAILSFVPWGEKGLSLDLIRERPDRVHGHRTAPARAGVRRGAGVAELRHVPGGLRARLPAGCRSRAASVVFRADLPVPLVAAGIALPGQRQVPARVGAALSPVRDEWRSAPHRVRRRPRRGLPRPARPAEARPPPAAAAYIRRERPTAAGKRSFADEHAVARLTGARRAGPCRTGSRRRHRGEPCFRRWSRRRRTEGRDDVVPNPATERSHRAGSTRRQYHCRSGGFGARPRPRSVDDSETHVGFRWPGSGSE
jgi:lysylphosphatidylglycerol synthetase-like protein (DUF2156 family)